jgi:hypothetical protein
VRNDVSNGETNAGASMERGRRVVKAGKPV